MRYSLRGRKLKAAAMRLAKMTGAEVAASLGVSRQAVYAYEREVCRMMDEAASRISRLAARVAELERRLSRCTCGVSEEESRRGDLRIEDLPVSTRVRKALARHDIATLSDLLRLREYDLSRMSGIGEKALSEIRLLLSVYRGSGSAEDAGNGVDRAATQ